jgi:hypothetical protein
MLGRPAGVICNFRVGDSGRGREGLDFFPNGLGGRPGPTDLENCGKEGVGGVKFVEFCVPAFRPLGVLGNEMDAPAEEGSRLTALFSGRKMPAPGMCVAK